MDMYQRLEQTACQYHVVSRGLQAAPRLLKLRVRVLIHGRREGAYQDVLAGVLGEGELDSLCLAEAEQRSGARQIVAVSGAAHAHSWLASGLWLWPSGRVPRRWWRGAIR